MVRRVFRPVQENGSRPIHGKNELPVDSIHTLNREGIYYRKSENDMRVLWWTILVIAAVLVGQTVLYHLRHPSKDERENSL